MELPISHSVKTNSLGLAYYNAYSPLSSLPLRHPHYALFDSGATETYVIINCPMEIIQPTQNPVSFRLPDGATMTSTPKVLINLPILPKAACHSHLVPSLTYRPIISVGALMDSGCTIIFTCTLAFFLHHGHLALTRFRDPAYGLWHVSITAINTA